MSSEQLQQKWISGDSGALILLPAKYLLDWEGDNPPSGGRVVRASFRINGVDAPATDYDRVCDIQENIGSLEVGSGNGLIVAPERWNTAWWPSGRTGGLLVCWQHAEREEDVLSSLGRVPETLWDPVDFAFSVPDGPLYLFDAGYPGREFGRIRDDAKIIIHLPAQTYTLATADYKPDKVTSLFLYRLRPKE